MIKVDINKEYLTAEEISAFQAAFKRCARRIILATTLAGSGHPGGSLSSLGLLLMVYAIAKVDPKNPRREDRDRVVISHGHISPGVYSVLCEYGFFPEEPFLLEFRRAGSAFAGHVEQAVPGVEWNTGNLGQGLSAACGMAKALKREGVEVIFGYPGGAVIDIYDELYKTEGIHHVLVRHEQGAAHAADGFARSTGRVGVALVTSGPGATNTVTGIATAYMDSIPFVVLRLPLDKRPVLKAPSALKL